MLEQRQESRYYEANLIRSVSMIGIVIFHTFVTLNKHFGYKYSVFHLYPNGDCGCVFVAIFFILSGFLLYRKYSSRIDVLAFYKKRWLSIFPAFYLSWIIFYGVHVFIEKKSFLWGGAIYKIILTIVGMDGYFYYRGMNYYLVGEWFLGAIIFLYLMFPVLIRVCNQYPRMLCIGIMVVWFWQINTDVFVISSYRNIVSCLVSFYIGILFAKYYDAILALQRNPFIVGVEIAFFLTCRLTYVSINSNILMHVMGAILYLLLITLAIFLSKLRTFDEIITWVASVSFCVYLVHHRIIYMVVPAISKGDMRYDTTVSLLICLPLSLLLGCAVSVASEKIKKALIARLK